jgi:hypothetical protein
MKLALLIPSTSNCRDNWKNIKDTYLYNYTIKSFINTKDDEHEYYFYIGYDENDRIYSDILEQNIIHEFVKPYNIICKFIKMNIEKGFLTKMWNYLFKISYNDGNDYFYQTGDDIIFKTKGWISDSIDILQQNNNIGLSGPMNNNIWILTQAMVSRKHMEIFGFFFPEEIKNWCCDDWYNYLYKPNYFYLLKNHYCSNNGGEPRYIINNDKNYSKNININTQKLRKYSMLLAEQHKLKIKEYISNN